MTRTKTKLQKKSDEVEVIFRFAGGAVDPGLITAKLGIQPEAAHRKGEPNPKYPGKKYASGFWSIKSELPLNASLADHLRSLLQLLEGKSKELLELKALGLDPNFHCGYFLNEKNRSWIYLDPELLFKVSKLGASIQIHIYP